MGIFDNFLKSIGFEDEEEIEEETLKEVKKEKKHELPMAKFNLKEIKQEKNTYFPTSQEEVEQIVKIFSKGENLIVELSKFEEEDRVHALDFLSGAAYALGGSIKKMHKTNYSMEH